MPRVVPTLQADAVVHGTADGHAALTERHFIDWGYTKSMICRLSTR